jgi:hypothetical protein
MDAVMYKFLACICIYILMRLVEAGAVALRKKKRRKEGGVKEMVVKKGNLAEVGELLEENA